MMETHVTEALRKVQERYDELGNLLSDPGISRDLRKLRDYSRERARLEETVRKTGEWRALAKTIADDEAAIASGDPELAEFAQAELPELRAKAEALNAELKRLLLPRDPDDDKNVIVEIRAGTGGDEASLFAGELYRMYSKYAEGKGWKQEVMSASESEVGGYKEIVFLLTGEDDFNALAATLFQGELEGPVYRIAPPPGSHGVLAADSGGPLLFGSGLTRDVISTRYAEGGRITKTQSAIVLEKMIGQFLFDKASSGGGK